MKTFKFVISVIKFILTTLIIVIIGVILIQRFSSNNMSLAGYRIFTVVTESMVPKYKVGDVILVKEEEKTNIQVGDDVTYMGKIGSYADKIVTHQVIEIEMGNDGLLKFHTKGIANEDEDPLVSEEQIYGVVQAKLQIITFLNGIINNMYGMYFLIIIPLAIIMFTEFKSFKEDKNYYEEDEDELENDDSEDNDEETKIDKKIKKRKEKRAKRRRRYE